MLPDIPKKITDNDSRHWGVFIEYKITKSFAYKPEGQFPSRISRCNAGGVNEDQATNFLTFRCQMQRYSSAERVPNQYNILQSQCINKIGKQAGKLFKSPNFIWNTRFSKTRYIGSNDLIFFRQKLNIFFIRRRTNSPAMQKQNRSPLSDFYIIQLHTSYLTRTILHRETENIIKFYLPKWLRQSSCPCWKIFLISFSFVSKTLTPRSL